ncbi:MAG: hypothetical protein M0Q01_03900 [Syntrophales bacterium]|jgi:hypothetical protein|nr:hypothetical protein [Syntrophales bacterium]
MIAQVGKSLLDVCKNLAKNKAVQKMATELSFALFGATTQKIIDKISNKDTNMSLTKRLKELDKLQKKGKLTKDEYDNLKKKIMDAY